MAGRLSIVATPIGCLEDITLRAIRVLQEADLILAEDTRHTRALCEKHGVSTPLRSFHAHSSEDKIERVIGQLAAGSHYALVSDAGTPLVSDPGASLVSRAAEAGVTVEPIPGPSAVVAALCVAGLPVGRFRFDGFLPRSGSARKRAFDRLVDSDCATVLFESPHRIRSTLDELEALLGEGRRIALCRELTKVHEETLRGTIPQVRSMLSDPVKGEITLVVEGRAAAPPAEDIDIGTLVDLWQQRGLTPKEMIRKLQEDHGWKRNAAYQAVLAALERGDD